MVLKYDGVLRAFKLKPDHVPTNLYGEVPILARATCEDYYKAGQATGKFHHIEAIFSGDTFRDDFDEVELGASSWQPKLDALQVQIDDLDSTYASDAEVVAAFATQIAAAGDIFTLVETKVAAEALLARAAEAALVSDVAQNEQDGDDDRALLRTQYAASDAVVYNDVVAEALLARAAEAALVSDVAQNEQDGDNDRALLRTQYAAADVVVNQAVVDEAAAARAAEGANLTAINVEKSRIDTIISLPNAALNNFAAIQAAYEAADNSADSALTALVTSKVASSDLDTLVTQVDAVEANTLKRDNTAQDSRYYERSLVDTAVGLRVLQSAFDTAIGDRQTTVAQEAAYRKISESLSKTEAQDADNLRVLQTDYNTAIGARQTTVAQEAAYRKISNSHPKADVYTKTAADAEFHTQTYVANQLALKQAVVGDDHLQISHTVGLTVALAGKQATVVNDALAIAHTSGLQAALNAKQATVVDDALAIAHTSGLQAALNAKQATVVDDALTIAHTSGLQAALNAKQATVVNDALAIAHTSGLQTALDAKAPKLDTSVLYHDAAGKVGVGTAAPSKTLHVHASASGDLARFSSDGAFNIQYMSDNKNFQFTHTGDDVIFYQKSVEVARFTEDGLRATQGLIVPAAVPANSGAAGVAGEIRYDASFIYICHATDSWKRVGLDTFS